jgi:hypothetical protein
MNGKIRHFGLRVLVSFICVLAGCSPAPERWQPDTDWGHWRLGHRNDLDFLRQNRFTVTFGSGAPNFEYVTRDEFDQKMRDAKIFNQTYHDSGYIVLRYLSTSLNGQTNTSSDIPRKEEIDLLAFYQNRWDDFTDYIGPRPDEDPTQWITVRPDGSFPFYRYAPYGKQPGRGFETWGCPNNPHYVRMMKGRIRAQAETGIDGSYVDWTHIAGGTCYCPYCKDAFIHFLSDRLPPEVAQKKYGESDYETLRLPEKRGDRFWMEWLLFRQHSVSEFHRELRKAARAVNPHFMISGNVFGGFGYGPIAYDAAGNMELLGADGCDDFIYSEIQEFLDSAPRKDKRGTKISNSPALKFLAAAGHGKPVIEYATEITPPIFPNPTEKCLSAMSQINIAEAAANHAIFREKRETPSGATAIYRFLAEMGPRFKGAELNSRIAVLASLHPYFADELSFAFSMSRVLADQGISHVMQVLNDVKSGEISGYDLLIVPYIPLLSDEEQDGLIRYVKSGGILLLLGPCGYKDAYNLERDHVPLAALLERDGYPDAPVEKRVENGLVCYQPLPIPDSRYLVPVRSREEVTTFGPGMEDVFPDIPEAYTRNRMDPELRAALIGLSEKAASLLSWNLTLVTGSPYVELTSMRNKATNQILLHLVNYDVTLDGSVTPAKGITVQVYLPENTKINSLVYSGTLSKPESLDYHHVKKDDCLILVFQPDHLEVYGLAILDLE